MLHFLNILSSFNTKLKKSYQKGQGDKSEKIDWWSLLFWLVEEIHEIFKRVFLGKYTPERNTTQKKTTKKKTSEVFRL